MSEEEVSQKFSHFIEKMTFGICSTDLLISVCQDNKLWSSLIRVVSLMVDGKNQVRVEHLSGSDPQGSQRQLRTQELQKLIDTAMEEYIQAKYKQASKSASSLKKFVDNLKKKQSVFAAQKLNDRRSGILNDQQYSL